MATDNGKINVNGFEWYVPHYTSILEQQQLLSKQLSSKIRTKLQYVEKNIFLKAYVLEIYGDLSQIPKEERLFLYGFFRVSTKKNNRDSQNSNIDTFYRPPLTCAQYFVGIEKHQMLPYY